MDWKADKLRDTAGVPRLTFVPPNTQTMVAALAVGTCYFLTARFEATLGFPSTPASTLWAPNAIVLATLLLVPRAQWWLYLLLLLPFHLAALLPTQPLSRVLVEYGTNVPEALIAAVAILTLCPEPRRFDRLRSMSVLIVFGCLIAPFAANLAMSAALVQLGLTENFRLTLIAGTLIDWFAVLTLVPLIVHAHRWTRGLRRVSRRRVLETCGLLAGTIVLATLAFIEPLAPQELFIPLPLLMWAGIRFGVSAACLSVLTLGAVATWSVMNGRGPWVDRHPMLNVLSLILFLDVMATLLLVLAATFAERREAIAARRRAEREAREQRQQVSLLSRTVLMGSLSGAFAHELNQPFTSIMANAQAALQLLKGSSAEARELREILGDIIREDRRGTKVLRNIQGLLSPVTASWQAVDLNTLIDEVLQLLRSDLRARHVTIVTGLDPQQPLVLADRAQIQRCLLNLILSGSDAAASAGEEQGELTLTTHYSAERHAVEIFLADSGSGIAAEDLAQMFQPFFMTRQNRVGLGLTASRSIVEAHGGRMWTEMRGHTAIVGLTLPANLAPKPA